MNLDDNDLFKHAMEDVTPLKECATIHWLHTPGTPDNFLIEGFIDVIPLGQPLEFTAEGIQQGGAISCGWVNISWMPA